jgi:hypothetical protein
VVVCHNHASSLLAHRLVNKCHHEENAAGRNTFWRPEVKAWQDLAHKTGGKVIWDARTSARKVVNYVPFICTPLGAVPKKLADGTIDPDNCRPTSDFSWPVPSVPLAAFVTAPNDLISLDDLPPDLSRAFASKMWIGSIRRACEKGGARGDRALAGL